MKITKVTYQKTYSIGPYLTERIGFEAEPTPYIGCQYDGPDGMEKHDEVLTTLEKMADEWHKKAHPHLYQEPAGFLTHEVKGGSVGIIQLETEPPADHLTAIQSAKSLEELRSFKLLSANDKTLYNAYNQRLKELSIWSSTY